MTKKKVKTDWKVILGGMVCLTAVELYNLSLGNNGTYLVIFVAIIAGAIGVSIDKPKFMK